MEQYVSCIRRASARRYWLTVICKRLVLVTSPHVCSNVLSILGPTAPISTNIISESHIFAFHLSFPSLNCSFTSSSIGCLFRNIFTSSFIDSPFKLLKTSLLIVALTFLRFLGQQLVSFFQLNMKLISSFEPKWLLQLLLSFPQKTKSPCDFYRNKVSLGYLSRRKALALFFI